MEEEKRGEKVERKRSHSVWGRRAALPPLLSISAHLECKCGFLYGSFVSLLTAPERSNYNCSIHSERERHAWLERGN